MLKLFCDKNVWNSFIITTLILPLTACNKSSSETGSVTVPAATVELTKDNYLSGKQFCQTYSSVTSAEHGQYVSVPKDYDHPEKGTLQIYVYLMSVFDPTKPSYVYVDGGPGQNTHGEMPDFFGGAMNEFRFDQRGLGCSAPDTWEEYSDVSLYS